MKVTRNMVTQSPDDSQNGNISYLWEKRSLVVLRGFIWRIFSGFNELVDKIIFSPFFLSLLLWQPSREVECVLSRHNFLLFIFKFINFSLHSPPSEVLFWRLIFWPFPSRVSVILLVRQYCRLLQPLTNQRLCGFKLQTTGCCCCCRCLFEVSFRL